MGKVSAIEWTDATWNPWYGCTKVSEGCKNCYMDRWAKRTGRDPAVVTRAKDATFYAPLKWKEPRLIFVCSLGDFFHPDVPARWRYQAMEVMFYTERHTYLILTKRPELINELMMKDHWFIMPNIWIGVSAENQKRANERIPQLLKIPAKVRFVSAEPLLGPIDFGLAVPCGYYCDESVGHVNHQFWTPGIGGGIHWIITGGESGPNARLCDLDWIRDIRDQCLDANIPFFHKQHGGKRKINGSWGGRELDGRTWNEIPSLR